MSKCKHCLNTEKNEIGEIICFCEEYDEPVNVTQGDCVGNCEMEEPMENKDNWFTEMEEAEKRKEQEEWIESLEKGENNE